MDLFTAVLHGIFWSFLNPYILFPAIIIGWWGRTTWVVVAGAIAIGLIPIGLSATQPLPPGSEIIWWLTPAQLIAPLVIAFTVFRVRRWLHDNDRSAPQSMAPRIARTIIGIVVGGFLGVLIVGAIGLTGITIAGVAGDAYLEAATMMMFVALLAMVAGLVIGGVWAWKRSGKVGTLPERLA